VSVYNSSRIKLFAEITEHKFRVRKLPNIFIQFFVYADIWLSTPDLVETYFISYTGANWRILTTGITAGIYSRSTAQIKY